MTARLVLVGALAFALGTFGGRTAASDRFEPPSNPEALRLTAELDQCEQLVRTERAKNELLAIEEPYEPGSPDASSPEAVREETQRWIRQCGVDAEVVAADCSEAPCVVATRGAVFPKLQLCVADVAKGRFPITDGCRRRARVRVAGRTVDFEAFPVWGDVAPPSRDDRLGGGRAGIRAARLLDRVREQVEAE